MRPTSPGLGSTLTNFARVWPEFKSSQPKFCRSGHGFGQILAMPAELDPSLETIDLQSASFANVLTNIAPAANVGYFWPASRKRGTSLVRTAPPTLRQSVLAAALRRPLMAERRMLAESYPQRSRRAPNSSTSCPKAPEHLPTSCAGSRDLARNRPILAELGLWFAIVATSANVYPKTINIGRFRRLLGQLGPSSAHFRPKLADVGQMPANFGPIWPEVDKDWAM